jgi:hypothetical protein
MRALWGRGLLAVLVPFAIAACNSSLAPDPLVPEAESVGDEAVETAAFGLDPSSPAVGEPVTFDARGVACGAAPCTYRWDDINKGTWPLGEGEVLTFTFRGAGLKRVQLTVTDARGRVTRHVTNVTILAAGAKPDGGSASSSRLTWAPPSGYERFTVVNVPVRGPLPRLDDRTDYRLVMPSSPRRQPLTIDGGRHVVVIGGEIDIEDARTGPESAFRGILVRGGSVNGRIVHLEGLLIHSRGGTISDGINTSAGDSRFVLQVQNVRIGPLPRAYRNGSKNHHPDVIQTWGGVGEVRVDRLTGISAYQGLFFKADFNGPHGNVDIRRTNLRGLTGGAYQLWLSDKGGRWPAVKLDDVWIEPSPGRAFARTMWPDSGSNAPTISNGRATWSRLPVTGSVRSGSPSGGDFVPASSVGIGYRSPGYR